MCTYGLVIYNLNFDKIRKGKKKKKKKGKRRKKCNMRKIRTPQVAARKHKDI